MTETRVWQVEGLNDQLCVGMIEHVGVPVLYLTRYVQEADGAQVQHIRTLGMFKRPELAAAFIVWMDHMTGVLNGDTE